MLIGSGEELAGCGRNTCISLQVRWKEKFRRGGLFATSRALIEPSMPACSLGVIVGHKGAPARADSLRSVDEHRGQHGQEPGGLDGLAFLHQVGQQLVVGLWGEGRGEIDGGLDLDLYFEIERFREILR